MDSLFNGTTINIIVGFVVFGLALVAIFTDSTPVKWVASVLAIFGLGVLLRRIFPSDGEIKRKYEENQVLTDRYYEDRKNALTSIQNNNQTVEELKKKKLGIEKQDGVVKTEIELVDTEIAQLEKRNEHLEKSIDKRKNKLDSFFARKDQVSVVQPRAKVSSVNTNVAGYSLKGDIE